MKPSILAASLTILLFAACDKKAETVNSPPPDSPKVEPPAPPKKAPPDVKPLAKKEEVPAKVEAAPAPPPKRLAPAGTYYAAERISVSNDDGIQSVAPGSRLTLVRKTEGGMLVKNDKMEFTVRPEQVTNDLDVAAQAAGMVVQSAAAQSATEQARMAVVKTQLEQAGNQTVASVQAADSALIFQKLQTKQALLISERADLQGKLQHEQEVAQRRNYAKNVLGRGSNAVTVPPEEVAKWRTRIAQIEVELRQVATSLNAPR